MHDKTPALSVVGNAVSKRFGSVSFSGFIPEAGMEVQPPERILMKMILVLGSERNIFILHLDNCTENDFERPVAIRSIG